MVWKRLFHIKSNKAQSLSRLLDGRHATNFDSSAENSIDCKIDSSDLRINIFIKKSIFLTQPILVWHKRSDISSFPRPIKSYPVLVVCIAWDILSTHSQGRLTKATIIPVISLFGCGCHIFTSAEWQCPKRARMYVCGCPVPSPTLSCARVSAHHSICHLRLEVPRLQTISTEQFCIYSA